MAESVREMGGHWIIECGFSGCEILAPTGTILLDIKSRQTLKFSVCTAHRFSL